MKIVGLVGTIFGSKTKIALTHLKFSDNINYEILDLANYNLEFSDGRAFNEYNEDTINLINTLMDADAIVIGTPIYQASIPGSLKNLFDLLPVDAIRDKPVGILVSSGSDKHYLVAQYQLIPVLDYLKADVINKYVYITQEHYQVNKIVSDDIDFRMEELVKIIEEKAKLYKEKMDLYDF